MSIRLQRKWDYILLYSYRIQYWTLEYKSYKDLIATAKIKTSSPNQFNRAVLKKLSKKIWMTMSFHLSI